jgi:hypothetical protein
MIYKEIESYDVTHNPNKVNIAITDNAKHFWCDLFVLVNGRGFVLDRQSKVALEDLAKKINEVLDK